MRVRDSESSKAWSVARIIRPLGYLGSSASFWTDVNELDLLTNLPWIAAEEQEDNLHLVLRKTLTPIIWDVPKLIAEESAIADTHL